MTDEYLAKIEELICVGDISEFKKHLDRHLELANIYFGAGTFLHTASHRGQAEIGKVLIAAGANVNAPHVDGRPTLPIDCAVISDNPDMVRLLLQNGADPNHDRLIISAIVGPKKKSLSMVRVLEEFGADIHRVFTNELANEPMNALSSAIDWGKDDVANYLRTRGVKMPTAASKSEKISSGSNINKQIVSYFEEQFGLLDKKSLIEIVPSEPSIAINVIKKSKGGNCITLFTTGMSSLPMNVPKGKENYKYAEIYIQLPVNWKFSELTDSKWGWPIHQLHSIGKYPHTNDTWLGGAVTIIANNDPPEPLWPNSKFTSVLLIADLSLKNSEGKTIQLYRMIPLYPEERDLEIRSGIGALMKSFDRYGVSFIVDINRDNVVRPTKKS